MFSFLIQMVKEKPLSQKAPCEDPNSRQTGGAHSVLDDKLFAPRGAASLCAAVISEDASAVTFAASALVLLLAAAEI